MSAPTKVLFLVPYPLNRAPSQRFRVENLVPLLDKAGIDYTIAPFMDDRTWGVLYKGGSAIQKATGILKGYWRRMKTVLAAGRYSHVFIHREAAPLGPPVFEWYLTRVAKKKVIYDFDDAIWIPNTSGQNSIAAGLKAFWKVKKICSWVSIVAGGNDYLCAYAESCGAEDVRRIPTVVDTANRYNQLKTHTAGSVTVGWTGSHSTLKYLDELMPVLSQLQEEYDFTFLVIADKQPELPLKNWKSIPWNPDTEIADLLKIDIGVMPLTHDQWSEGKCGFKLIQYLSLGIPGLASSVGVNKAIIRNGENGYLCDRPEEWKDAIGRLINDVDTRREMGRKGRETIVQEYSIASQEAVFLGLFK